MLREERLQENQKHSQDVNMDYISNFNLMYFYFILTLVKLNLTFVQCSKENKKRIDKILCERHRTEMLKLLYNQNAI